MFVWINWKQTNSSMCLSVWVLCPTLLQCLGHKRTTKRRYHAPNRTHTRKKETVQKHQKKTGSANTHTHIHTKAAEICCLLGPVQA